MARSESSADDAFWPRQHSAVLLIINFNCSDVAEKIRRPETTQLISAHRINAKSRLKESYCDAISGAIVMDLRISGTKGSVNIDDFLSQSSDGSADYRYRAGGWGPDSRSSTIKVESPLPGSALMFEDFAAMVAKPALQEQWATASLRTQTLLDAVRRSALNNE
jgi:predicted dehydrogenase